jgi:hypothetical protein
MATKTSQIIIDIDTKSLTELNDEIKVLQASMKDLKTNTADWVTQNEQIGVLKQRFNEATAEAKKLQNVVKDVNSAEQLRSVAKLGRGLVGAFAAASTGAELFGLANKKEFAEVAAKAQNLLTLMIGLREISEAFSARNIAGLAAIGNGFKNLVTTVKGFSVATKEALIETGIGIFVVALGLVIANWDKIKIALSGVAGEQKKTLEGNQNLVKSYEDLNKVFDDRNKLIEEYNKYAINKTIELNAGESYNTYKSLLTQQDLLAKNIEAQKASLTDVNGLIDQQTKAHIKLLDAQKLESSYAENSKEYGAQQVKLALQKYDIAQLAVKTAQTTLANDLLELSILKDITGKRAKAIDDQKDENEARRLATEREKNEIIVLNSQKDTENEIFKKKGAILLLEYDRLWHLQNAGVIMTKDELDRLATIQYEVAALKNENNLRIHNAALVKQQYEDNLKNLKTETELSNLIADLKLKYTLINTDLKIKDELLQNSSKSFELETSQITEQTTLFDKLIKIREAIDNFDKTGVKNFYEMYDAELLRLNLNKEEVDLAKEQLIANIDSKGKEGKLFDQRANAAAVELVLYTKLQETNREKLETDKKILENNLLITQSKIDEAEANQKILEKSKSINDTELLTLQTRLKETENDPYLSIAEKRQKTLDIESKINAAQLKGKEIDTSIAENNDSIVTSKGEILKTNESIAKTNQDIDKTTNDINDKTTDTTAQLKEQARVYAQLQDFVGKYSKEIDVSRQILEKSMELMATLQDNVAQKMDERIAAAQAKMDKITKAETDRTTKLSELNDELKDANGERYDQILAEIDLQKKQQDDNRTAFNKQAQDEASAQNKKNAAEKKAAQWRKAEAITDAIIQGALAVIKALPNVFLSIATGVLAATEIATIAAAKIPDEPKAEVATAGFKSGGFTGYGNENEPAGIAHRQEYIVPARVVQSPSAKTHIAALESQRLRGYASGGYVAPNNSGAFGDSMDYDRLVSALSTAIASLPASQVSLVAISNGIRDVSLTKQNAGMHR